MKIYLAGPFFNEVERARISLTAYRLRKQGFEVYVPMEHDYPDAWEISNKEWSKRVFEDDVTAIKNCDKVIAIVGGMTSDAGTCWEVGFAYGIEKPVEVVLVEDEEKYSLMICNGCESITNFIGQQIDHNTINQG